MEGSATRALEEVPQPVSVQKHIAVLGEPPAEPPSDLEPMRLGQIDQSSEAGSGAGAASN